MNESEWLTCKDPLRLLNGLLDTMNPLWHQIANITPGGVPKIRPSDRKLRLFACAVARLLENIPPNILRTKVIDACELIADGISSSFGLGNRGLLLARRSIQAVWGWTWSATCERVDVGLEETLIQMRGNAGSFYQQDKVANLVREIVSNPFQPVSKDPYCSNCGSTQCNHKSGECRCDHCSSSAWMCFDDWLTPTVVSLAARIYNEWDFAAMPILGDALEDAGCPTRVATEGPPIECVSRDVCPYCTYWPANSPHGENGWVKCKRWKSELITQEYGRCGRCNRVWLPGYDTIVVVTYQPHPVLLHLRDPGPHVRGCWVLDLLLWKE